MENIKKAPASITVITERQIRQMGAMSLFDVFRAVPGFDMPYHLTGTFMFIVRGGFRSWSASVLVMINSHPLNNAEDGGAAWVHDTLIIDNIKRIEFIRGPGSALYGANAYHGVINVIAKDAEDIDGFELTARGGSWDTQQYNLLFGKTFNELEVAFNFNYGKTHGFKGLVEEDFQTQLDRLVAPFGFPPASLAPGSMAGDREKYDVALNLKYKGFEFDGRYVDKEWDFPIGWSYTLNHKTISPSKDYYLNLSYEVSLLEGLDFFGKVYRNLFDFETNLQVYPPGFVSRTPAFPFFSFMPDVMIWNWHSKSSRTGIEIQTTYKISDSNTIVSGATYEEQKDYGTLAANFLPTSDPNAIIPLPWVTEWPSMLAGATQKRNFKAFFLEDIWDITDDLRLTAGARYDRYSDFGSELSPRRRINLGIY